MDVTETGSSLKANQLRVIDVVQESTPRFIANHAAAQDSWKRAKMERMLMLLSGVIAATTRVGLSMNVPRERLERVLELLPNGAPTLSPLADEDWVDVFVIIEETRVREIIPMLHEAGARVLVETTLTRSSTDPVGRIRNLAALPYAYLQTLYSGLVSARLIESSPLVVCQGLTLRESERGQEILLSVRSDVRGWELPGGRVESGEQVSEALAREMREETGLDVEVGRHVGDYVRTGFRPHVARVYVCQVRSGKERPSLETLEISWFPIAACLENSFRGTTSPLRTV